MGTSGSGTGTPISGGSAASGGLAFELPYTHLSLFQYARLLGINPCHFAGANTPDVFVTKGTCEETWFRHSWQNADRVSHEDLAYAIKQSEDDITRIIGYNPAPDWTSEEQHFWPRFYRREMFGLYGRTPLGNRKSILLRKGRFIAGGRRAVSLVGTVAPVYSDPDGDGFFERATVQVATALTDVNEIKVYVPGRSGAQAWELRYPRSKTLSGGTFTAIFDSWILIDPDNLSVYPSTTGPESIDLTTTTPLLSSVDVYREYNDTTQAGATFYWENGGAGCTDPGCSPQTQDGCLSERDGQRGVAVPVPATYDVDSGSWTVESWTGCKEPDFVKLWYLSGAKDEGYLRGSASDPLSLFLAQAIAWMATARLERPMCGCTNLINLANDLREDLTISTQSQSRFASEEAQNCPFGTRKGEVMAWLRVRKIAEGSRPHFAVV